MSRLRARKAGGGVTGNGIPGVVGGVIGRKLNATEGEVWELGAEVAERK